MTEISGNPFACRSADWREGYEAGIAAFSTELSALKAKGLIAEAAEITRLTERCAALEGKNEQLFTVCEAAIYYIGRLEAVQERRVVRDLGKAKSGFEAALRIHKTGGGE